MKKAITIIIILALAVTGFAQKRNITLDEIWKNYKFYPRSIDELRSTSDGEHYTSISFEGGIQTIVSHDYLTGKKADTLLTTKDLMNTGKAFIIESYELSPGEKNILLSTGAEHIYGHSSISRYFIWNREKKTLTKLTDDNDKVM